MYVCMYVCVYIYIYIYIYMYTCVYIYIYTYVFQTSHTIIVLRRKGKLANDHRVEVRPNEMDVHSYFIRR